MEETISRMAGSQYGSPKSVAAIHEIAAGAGRQARQRDTVYGELSAERLAASAGFDEHVARLLPLVGGS